MCMTCLLLAKIDTVKFAVDIEQKDQALTKLAHTEELYTEVAKDFQEMSCNFEHMESFSNDGVEIFDQWNSK